MDIDLWNQEDAEELRFEGTKLSRDLVVFSRDWTVETLISQVSQGNIQIDPVFQRRHVWSDAKRSTLIESLLIKFPVPQIVIAEHPKKEKSFIVIDGKQRVSTLAALMLEPQRKAWDNPVLSGLKLLPALNGVSLEELMGLPRYAEQKRHLLNSDIRTTIITNYKDERLLYSIFYRLNTTSTPLSSQELRHALSPGEFATFLSQQTSSPNPIWGALGLAEPDSRLRDAELLLRLLSLRLFAEQYKGNLREFLDNTLRVLNSSWVKQRSAIEVATKELMVAVDGAIAIFGEDLGRKYLASKYESKFNRAVFEVQSYSLLDPKVLSAAKKNSKKVREAFQELCDRDADFLDSVESTTKSVEKFRIRFERYSAMLAEALKLKVVSPRFKTK